MTGTHNPALVVLAFLIAIMASYTALDLASRVAAARGRARHGWLLGGSFAMGVGIWSMHFVAMLAFSLPVPIAYNVPLVLLSVLVAVAASWFALSVVSGAEVRVGRLAAAAPIMGGAIAGMHYTGMAAMRMQARLSYDPALFAASVAIAVAASFAALWLFLRFRSVRTMRAKWLKRVSAVVMAVAIVGMHFTGMAAARYSPELAAVSHRHSIPDWGLATPVTFMAVLILATALLASIADRAIEAAHASAHAKGEFLANMSHEIRTPLNGVMGMLELALGTPLSPAQRDYLHTAKTSADSLLTILNDVLDFSKIEAGRVDLEAAPFTVRGDLWSAVNALSARADEKGLELVLRVAPGVPDALVGDVFRLRQVLLNLVGNAIKFTPQGEVVVSADVETQSSGTVALHFSVADTGIGIPRHKQQSIFEAFTQADTSTTREYGGTGLGLAIASRLVARMGGRIWVESEVGRGSTFHFTATVARGAGAASGEPPAPLDARVLPVAPRPLRILLAEDNAVNRKLAVAVLQRRGHSVATAANGRSALEALEQQPFDLVLMDIQMPEMGGLEATAAIRDRERASGSHVPIVAMTARAMPGDREQCLAAGMDGYVAKPVAAQDLCDAVEKLAGRAARSPFAAPLRPPGEEPRLPVLDERALRQSVDGDGQLARELAELFLSECPRLMREIRSAVRNGDAAALQLAAHTLKSSAGSLAARRAFSAALKLETLGRGGRMEGAAEALHSLDREIANVEAALEVFARADQPWAVRSSALKLS